MENKGRSLQKCQQFPFQLCPLLPLFFHRHFAGKHKDRIRNHKVRDELHETWKAIEKDGIDRFHGYLIRRQKLLHSTLRETTWRKRRMSRNNDSRIFSKNYRNNTTRVTGIEEPRKRPAPVGA